MLAGLTELELRTLAVYLGGRPLGSAPAGDAAAMPNRCTGAPGDSAAKPAWNGWGFGRRELALSNRTLD
ncbi:MAG: hypothetical protein WDO18_17210 [Acidobacteriota bacterium]